MEGRQLDAAVMYFFFMGCAHGSLQDGEYVVGQNGDAESQEGGPWVA